MNQVLKTFPLLCIADRSAHSRFGAKPSETKRLHRSPEPAGVFLEGLFNFIIQQAASLRVGIGIRSNFPESWSSIERRAEVEVDFARGSSGETEADSLIFPRETTRRGDNMAGCYCQVVLCAFPKRSLRNSRVSHCTYSCSIRGRLSDGLDTEIRGRRGNGSYWKSACAVLVIC